jgi:hypothetical protein
MIFVSHRVHRALRGIQWSRTASIKRGDRLKAKGGKPLQVKTSELVFVQRLPSFVPIVSIETSPSLWEVLSD